MDHVLTVGDLAFWALLIIGIGVLAAAALMLFASGFSTNPTETRKAERSSLRVGLVGGALVALAFLATGCTDPAPGSPAPTASEFTYGPSCLNDTGSCGVPAGPTRTAEGLVLEIPQRSSLAHINYVTRPTGSLEGKTQIRIRFRVDVPEGSMIRATKPRGDQRWDGKLWLYFERRGNNFTGGPEQNFYRWWATESETRLHNGEYEVVARFDDLWAAVSYGANRCGFDPSNDPVDQQGNCRGPGMFRAALANAGRVGFTLGGGDGKGHGVDADGPGAQLTVLEFAIE